MTKHVAFLRAVNVGGTKIIKMDELRRIFASFGFENVQTFIQSGNLIFSTPASPTLEQKIEGQLEQALGYRVEVFLRTLSELEMLIKKSPFEAQGEEVLHVSFLRNKPSKAQTEALKRFNSTADEFVVAGREVFNLRRNREKSVFSNNFIEKICGPATTRNVTTLKKIVEKYQS